MSVQSSIPVAINALRGLINERSEFLITNVLEGQPAPGAFGSVVTQPRVIAGYIRRFADGGGWNTEIVLENMNSSDAAFVTLDFIAASGDPVSVTFNSQTASSFNFTIQRGDSQRCSQRRKRVKPAVNPIKRGLLVGFLTSENLPIGARSYFACY
jgi:hypothetical protein